MLEQNMKNDAISGEFKMYYENGNLKEIGKCVSGKKEGKAIVYYLNGKIKDINYYKDDKEEGQSLHYDLSGRLLIDAVFENGYYVRGVHYNYKKNDRKKSYGLRVGEIQKLYNEDSSLFFVKNLSNDSYIQIHSKDKIEAKGNIDFLTRDDSLNFNKYYPGWQNKLP